MDEKENLLTIMNKRFPKMSKSHKNLAAYLAKNYDKAVFLTAAQLGKEVGTSESTVVRFASSMGYSGFPKLQQAMEDLVRDKLSQMKRIEFSQEHASRSELIRTVLQSDIAKLEETLNSLDLAALDIAVANILQADTIYIMGIRSCAPLAQTLQFYLNMICPRIVLLQSTSHSEIFEQMMRISERDVMIGISFPRYSMRTLKAMEFASSRSAKIITITDSIYSPMNLYSSCNLLAKSDLSSVVDSLVAPLSIINALIMALYMEREEEVLSNIEMVDQLWEDYQIYSKDEINYVDPQKGMNLNE